MNLKQLLALPLAFALTWMVIPIFSYSLIHYHWTRALNDISSINREIDMRFGFLPRTKAEMIQRWLNGKLDARDPPEIPRDSDPYIDPWHNPYRVCERVDEAGQKRFLAYSVGRDGKSDTNGNDPDDINSWSDEPAKLYKGEAFRDRQSERLKFAMLWTGLLYVPLYLMCRKRQETEPRDAHQALDETH